MEIRKVKDLDLVAVVNCLIVLTTTAVGEMVLIRRQERLLNND